LFRHLFLLTSPLLLLIVYLALVWMQPIHIDSGVFFYAGQVIARGGAPYVDVWEHKGPLLFLLNALGYSVLPGIRGVYLLEGILLAGALLASLYVWQRSIDYRLASLTGIFFVVSYLLVFDRGNYSETWQVPFNLIAYSFLAGWILNRQGIVATGPSTRATALLIGVAGGVAAMIRVNNGLGVATAACILVLFANRERFSAAGWVMAGGLLVVVPVMGYIVTAGAASAMIDQYLNYNFAYVSGNGLSQRLSLIRSFIPRIWELPLWYMLPIAILVLFSRNGAPASPVALALLSLAVLADGLGVLSAGRDYTHYLIMLVPALTVTATLVFVGVSVGRVSLVPSLVILPLTVLMLYPNLQRLKAQGDRIYAASLANPQSDAARVVDFIETHTAPDDPVLTYGWGPGLPALADRPAPSRFSYLTPLLNKNLDGSAMVDELFDDIRGSVPAIVVRGHNTCPFELDHCPPPDEHSVPESDRLAHIRTWIVENYLRREVFGPYEIWVRRQAVGVATGSTLR
jgi:hypothetical protein